MTVGLHGIFPKTGLVCTIPLLASSVASIDLSRTDLISDRRTLASMPDKCRSHYVG